MPEHFRSFVVVLGLSLPAFFLLRGPLLALGMAEADFRRRRTLWLLLTTIAFVSSSFWLFVAAASLLLLFARRAERNPLPLYLFLLFVVPPFAAALPGLGIVNQLFELSFPRLLALLLLLPWVLTSRDDDRPPFGRFAVDWLVLAFLALQIVLQLRADSATNTLRSAFYAVTDVLLPYFVASRSLRSTDDIRQAFLALAAAVLLMVPVAAFEYVKYWLLYSSLPAALGMAWDGGSYLGRGDSLRAIASTGHPIVLGYVMAIAMFVLAGVRRDGARRGWVLAEVSIGVGLVVSLSRGPWVGAAVGLVVMAATARRPAKALAKLIAIGGAAVGLLLLSPWAGKVIDYLPFVGEVDRGNVDYRQQLFDAALQVIAQHPLFGSPYFMDSGPLQELRSGNLIDIVNSYLLIALQSGYVGLAAFVAVFAVAVVAVLRSLRRQRGGDVADERHLQGRALLAAMAAMLVTIGTVSNIHFIPLLYWCLAGFAVAYAAPVPGEVPARRRRGAMAMETA